MTAGSADPLSTSWAELLREKRSLAAIVRDAGRLCIQDSVDIVLDVCDELANAHANGIVHGDLGLHRVRTIWPRRPGDVVEIWALDADDTGAIDFRAAFQAPALAPEQRAGKIGDVRADIWAVGAVLHALIGGAPPMAGPAKRPVKDMLPGAPRALVSIVEQCLADDPDARPRSVDDVAGALASFASNSPERFQQLARRRIASLKAKHVPAKVTTLSRLDEAAVHRESGRLAAAPANHAFPPPGYLPVVPAPAASPLMKTGAPTPYVPAHGRAIPAAPTTQPTVGALRAPTRPSYSDAQLPEPVRMTSRPSYSEHSVSLDGEWPPIHGAPSMSIAASNAAPAPRPNTAAPDAPTKAQPRSGTVPVIEPAPQVELPPTMTAPALAHKFDPNVTVRMNAASMFPPSAAFPSAMPVAPVWNDAAANVAAANVSTSPSMTPPPVTVEPAVAHTPAPYIPPAPQAYRQRSYHPPSFGPMSIDTGADELHFPPAARVPSFSDLAEYREAKRKSRRSGIMAVAAAAAVIIVGFSYGGRVIKEDRDNMRAAAAAQAPAPPPPQALVSVPAAATPATSSSAKPADKAEAKPEAKAEAKSEKTEKAEKKAQPTSASKKAAPAPRKPVEPKADKADAIPKESEFTPDSAFKDAIGKKDPAPANALTDGLGK